jgi:hypothetical protein
MAYEQRPGQGQLFVNRNRSNANAPNLKGEALIEIDGKSYPLELAA